MAALELLGAAEVGAALAVAKHAANSAKLQDG